jgi:hypothetical protein
VVDFFLSLLPSLTHAHTRTRTTLCRLLGGLDIMRDMGSELADALKE